MTHPFVPGQDQQGCLHWDRNVSSPAAAVCPGCVQAVTVQVTCSKGQSQPLPQWRNPPSSSALHFSGCAHTAPESCSDLLLKTSAVRIYQAPVQPRLVFPLHTVSSSTILCHKAELFPFACHHRHKEELSLKPLPQPFLPWPWLSKPPLCPALDFPVSNSRFKSAPL